MPFTKEQLLYLKAPLHPQHVSERKQSGRALSYIEGWHAIAEANRIFGFDAWDRRTVMTSCVAEAERMIGKDTPKKGWGVSYIARVQVNVTLPDSSDLCIREGTGAGHGIDVDRGLAHESAIKEAETDAMKRALMTFGNPFGLALYDKEKKNVSAIDQDAVTSFIQEMNAVTTLEDCMELVNRAETIEMADALKKEDPAEYRTIQSLINSRRKALAPKDPDGAEDQ